MASNVTLEPGFSANTTRASVLSQLQDIDFLLVECKIILSAVGIIYLGSHAAIRRPPSAAISNAKKKGERDDDEDRLAQGGLEPADAIFFPVMAAMLLVGLYYLIQWLQDPAILNKILQYYMSIVSLASVLTLYAHGLDLATSLVFPTYWRSRDGSLYKADQKTRSITRCDDVGNPTGPSRELSPLPGPLGILGASPHMRNLAWECRASMKRQCAVKLFIRGMGERTARFRLSHVVALLLSAATALVYFSTTSPFLSNMLGYGMCYGSLLLLSPTDFLTGSLVLAGLFIYDIFMVFYTPYMIYVATNLDVPIKLTFETASRKSILGLGDIVIPGMVIAWALRLDLWMHYARKVKYETTDLTIVEKDVSSGKIVTRSEIKHREVKSPYVDARNRWGDAFWIRMWKARNVPADVAAARFPKVYFLASLAGFLGGLSVTLIVLLVSGHGQPALLYLVPGVLGALVLTALARGEFGQVWAYTEDGSLDTVDVVVDLDGDGQPTKTIGLLQDGVVDTTKDEKEEKKKMEKKRDQEAKTEAAERAAERRGHKVFVFLIEALPEDED